MWVEKAREIIADGFGCHRECENDAHEFCGCRDDAQKIIDLTGARDMLEALQHLLDGRASARDEARAAIAKATGGQP